MWSIYDPQGPSSSDLTLFRRLDLSLPRQRPIMGVSSGIPRAPLRVDIPLLDPCSGLLSVGSGATLGPFIPPHSQLSSDLRLPPALRDQAGTAPPRTVSLSLDMRPDKAWSSRRVHQGALQARLRAPEAGAPLLEARAVTGVSSDSADPQEPVSDEEWVSDAVRRYIFTSATQRGYGEVNWDRRLPRRLRPPDSTLEKMADPVSERAAMRRYHERPQLWQVLGTEWSQRQIRVQEDVRKPVTFCSVCRRSGQIPGYTGQIGSRNKQDLDDEDRPFCPLTLRRSLQPPYTPTARRSTVPGYSGRGVFADLPHPEVSVGCDLRRPLLGHWSPLSRMVTRSSPGNPFR